jgi:hypothetical protein
LLGERPENAGKLFNMTMPGNLFMGAPGKYGGLEYPDAINDVDSRHLKHQRKEPGTRPGSMYDKNQEKMMNRTVFSPSFMNTTLSDDYSSISYAEKRRVTSVLPETPTLPFAEVSKVLPKINENLLFAGLAEKDNKHSKLMRQYSNIGMIEAVSIVKETGCKNFDDLYRWADKLLVTHPATFIIQELQSCIISWKRSSVFCSV